MTWDKGMEVRLSYNPGRVGACTGRLRENGPITRVQVRFPDGWKRVASFSTASGQVCIAENPMGDER